MWLDQTNHALVINNKFENFNRGIFALECYNTTVISNTCLDTKEYGAIYFSYSNLGYILNNTCNISLVYDGIRLYQSTDFTICYNILVGCENYGVNLQPGSYNNIIYASNKKLFANITKKTKKTNSIYHQTNNN